MENYELTVIINPEFNDEKRKVLIEKISGFVAKKGKVEKITEWGSKTLTYYIKKKKEGYFVLFDLLLPVTEVGNLNQKVKLEEDILRYLLIRKD